MIFSPKDFIAPARTRRLENHRFRDIHRSGRNSSISGGKSVYKSHLQIKISILRFTMSFETIGWMKVLAVKGIEKQGNKPAGEEIL
jgi:hypothetical protein